MSEIMTYTGRTVNPLALRVEDVVVADIAHALSMQCRYSGHVRLFYSVAQHAVLCYRLLASEGADYQTQFTALHHDDAEYILQDMARPLKEDPRFGQAYRGAEQRAEKVIAESIGFTYPFPPSVKLADTRMLGAEARDLMPAGFLDLDVLQGIDIPEEPVLSWKPEFAERVFLREHTRLVNCLELEHKAVGAARTEA